MVGLYALALAACGSDASDAARDAPEGPDGSYTIDRESGVTRAEIRTGDGVARMESGASLRADLPEPFTLYPDAEIRSVTNVAGARAGGTLVTMVSEDALDLIAEFYRDQASAASLSIELDMAVDNGRMLAAKSASGLGMSLNLRRGGGLTEATLMVGRDPV